MQFMTKVLSLVIVVVALAATNASPVPEDETSRPACVVGDVVCMEILSILLSKPS